MSKSTNMLRTRRRDNNVKPNRRLDRKSSRGMIYENEELRLKTININAEIERGQSDIKKLKRENEMLKKEIWCLRDEYDKLDKLLKDKKIEFSSSSTTCSSSSDSETCSSCSEESEEVETSQNLENVQKTNLKNIHQDFDHLSVVPEEPSTENSEKNSTRNSLPNESWQFDGIIQPDQSYPIYENVNKSKTLPVQDKTPANFFSPIKTSKSFDEASFNQIYPGQFYSNSVGHYPANNANQPYAQNYPVQDFNHDPNCQNYVSKKMVNTTASSFYQNITIVPKSAMDTPEVNGLEKTNTDLIVKMDNHGFSASGNRQTAFSNTPSQSTFSNGGNLEELLNDIESISQRGTGNLVNENGGEFHVQIRRDDLTYFQNPVMDNLVDENEGDDSQRPYKSELNVVLMPSAMPLIGFDKYKNIQRSFESLNKQSIEELSVSQQNLCILPQEVPPGDPHFHQPFGDPPPLSGSPYPPPLPQQDGETNPFFFGNMQDNYVNSDYFNMRYNPENFLRTPTSKEQGKAEKKSGSKSNLELTSSEHVSSENEENLKFKTTNMEKQDEEKQNEEAGKTESAKSPKLSIRRKVSIHFKGKKDKTKKINIDRPDVGKPPKPMTEKKHSLFDIKFSDKSKGVHQKTPSIESKKSTTETSNVEPKTPTSSDSKNSFDKKTATAEGKGLEKKEVGDKKGRKSVSVSPERKHVHVKEEEHKKHKKHKRSDRMKTRRGTMTSIDPRQLRERSYSVCTDRSLGLGFGGSFLYDDFSDRDRTSISSCETLNTTRKMSTLSNVPINGKVPWCGCWGNGCL